MCAPTECGLGLLVSQPPHGPHPGPLTRDGPETPPLPAVRGPSPSASRRRGRGAPPCPSLPRFELARSACAAPFEPTHMPPVTALPRSTRDDSHVAQNDCTIIVRTLSLLGEKGEGVVFSRPLRALRAASSLSLSLAYDSTASSIYPNHCSTHCAPRAKHTHLAAPCSTTGPPAPVGSTGGPRITIARVSYKALGLDRQYTYAPRFPSGLLES